MAIVQSLDELKGALAPKGAEYAELIKTAGEKALSHHADLDLSRRPFKLVGTEDTGECNGCNEPTFRIREQVTGRTTHICRECINAVRLQSLADHPASSLCLGACYIDYDSLGLVQASNHIGVHSIEDTSKVTDGIIVATPGLTSLIADGRVDLTNGVATINESG